MVNYHQSLAFDCPSVSCNDHCEQWIFQETFFINIIFYSQKFLWTILNLFSWNLKTFTKHKEQVCFLFVCFFFFFFTYCFIIVLCINTPTFHTFPLRVNIQDESVLFLIVVSQSLYVITLSTFCTWTRSLKWTTLPCQFSQWRLNFLKIWLTSAEIRMSQLSKV